MVNYYHYLSTFRGDSVVLGTAIIISEPLSSNFTFSNLQTHLVLLWMYHLQTNKSVGCLLFFGVHATFQRQKKKSSESKHVQCIINKKIKNPSLVQKNQNIKPTRMKVKYNQTQFEFF